MLTKYHAVCEDPGRACGGLNLAICVRRLHHAIAHRRWPAQGSGPRIERGTPCAPVHGWARGRACRAPARSRPGAAGSGLCAPVRALRAGLVACLACGLLAGTGLSGEPASGGTRLGIEGTRFTINGRPAFLCGISYYGGLGATEERLHRDLDDLQHYGLNWVRVWATWAAYDLDVSAVDTRGMAREPYLGRLCRLVAECDRRGVIVDVTLTRGTRDAGAGLSGFEAHRGAVGTLLEALRSHGNWYLDLANERNIQDARFVSFEELRELRQFVRKADPGRLVTASHGGDISRRELREYLATVGVDFIAPHRSRYEGTAAETEAQSRTYLEWMQADGHMVPVHYQEPFRRDYDRWQPAAEDFLTDLRGALAGGAAGWCLHNGGRRNSADGQPRRSFDLTERRLFEQLDQQELAALASLRPLLAGTR